MSVGGGIGFDTSAPDSLLAGWKMCWPRQWQAALRGVRGAATVKVEGSKSKRMDWAMDSRRRPWRHRRGRLEAVIDSAAAREGQQHGQEGQREGQLSLVPNCFLDVVRSKYIAPWRAAKYGG